LLDKAGGVAVEIIREQYPLILAGKARRIRQDHRRATYCSLRGPDDARIDWRASNAQVHNLIRAQSPPYPGAFSYAPDGSKIYILKSVLCGSGYFGVPGMVAQVCTDCAVVCCGSGAIRVYAVGLSPLRPQPSSGLLKFGMRMV
jgi:methionyl-tRNA formyltransferase